VVEEEVAHFSTDNANHLSRKCMKLRSLIVATVVLLALLGTLYWSGRRKNAEEASAKPDASPAILKLDESAITRLEFKKKDAEPVVLAKNNAGTWAITEPKPLGADQGSVSSTLSTLASLSSERVVEDHPTDLKPFGLEQSALEIDVTSKDNKQQRLLIGDETPTGSAHFAKLAADPRVYTIATYNKTSLDKGLNDLRDKRLLTIDANKVSRVELTAKNQTIEFGRNKDDWQILKPKPLRADNFQAAELVRKLTDAKMNLGGSSTDTKDDALAFAHGTPVAGVKITDPSGTQDLQVRKNKDAYYAKSSIMVGAYKVDADLGSALEKSLDDFREKKVFNLGFGDPDKIEMHNGAKSYFFTRKGADWWGPDGKKMDAASVQDFVSKLRDLTATKLLDSGFTNSTVDITVATDDGKRIEKVALAKSGDVYLARRENDSTIYSLKSDSVESVEKAADDIKPAAKPAK
jgi:uncharacterized protein DUF4340